jgi:hypothetical protein
MEMGLQGGLAKDQDEPPIAFNLGASSSQRAFLDCDDASGSNLAQEIQDGCGPRYGAHQFTYSPYCPNVSSVQALVGPHAAPWNASNGWPPTRCVITQTGASNQVLPGLNLRLFGVPNNPVCPSDANEFVEGRNYWHRDNNQWDNDPNDPSIGANFAWDGDTPGDTPPATDDDVGNKLKLNDPRLVTFFFTPYDSFSSTGNEVFPIVGFGAFYITGYGRTTAGGGAWQGGAPEDPCTGGNSGNPFDGLPFGVGNEPPPDLNLGRNQTWVWGHFINAVFLTTNATSSGRPCNPGATFQPCVAVLVE